MGNPRPILAHMVTPGNSDLCIHWQALETRQGNDSIKALWNCISPLFQVLPIYGTVGNWKENRKLFTFLNDAIDLRKHGIKKEIQCWRPIGHLYWYLDQFNKIKKLVKKYGFHNFNTTLTFRTTSTFRHDLNIPNMDTPRPKSASGCGPPSQIWTPYQTFLLSIVCVIFGN